jgi:hypothetical protein
MRRRSRPPPRRSWVSMSYISASASATTRAILAELIGANGEGDDDRVPCRARRPRYGEFCADAAYPRGARRWHARHVRTRRRHLCQCGRDAAPADAWLDRLKERGRLILPLTADGFPNRDVRRGVALSATARALESLPARPRRRPPRPAGCCRHQPP